MSNLQNKIYPGILALTFSFIFILVTVFAFADNDWTIKVNGRVTEDNIKLEGAIVSLIKNSRLMQEVVTSSSGKFVFVLKSGNDYLIEVSKPGYAGKSITFSTKNVPQENIGSGFPDFPIEIQLIQRVESVDMSVLDEPVGRIHYSSDADDFTIDMEYNKAVKAGLAQLGRDIRAAKSREMEVHRQTNRDPVAEDDVEIGLMNAEQSSIPEIVVEADKQDAPIHQGYKGAQLHTGLELLKGEREKIRKQLDFVPASLVSVEFYEDGGKEILIRIVHKSDLYIEYKRVTQPWGARYFFRDGVAITEHLFQLESDVEALLESKVFSF